ncbi:MAG: T9SS type A sorting domain-containing protein [candidate division Zixibacteria bacterium]|nr:T9SS type A sorting domain-containing protein [candidate division Zixibacteria bacterium]
MRKIYGLGAILVIFITFQSSGQTLPVRYHTYQEVLDTLQILTNTHGDIIRVDTMGYSTTDSIPILRVKISDNPRIDEDEPAVFFCGGVHADEVLGVEIIVGFISDIVHKYDLEDPTVIRYVESLEIFAIPFVNPEGHIVVENGITNWRKNKSDNNHNGVFDNHDGVDNNRNYDFGWSIDAGDTVTTPESLMYKGPAPFSESENRAMRDFAWKYRPLVCLDFHSPTYGRAEKAYYPWYWYSSQGGHGMAPDEPLMLSICQQYCARIIRDTGNPDSTYEARRALVNKGDLKTYMYGNFGTAAFTVEVSDTTIQDPALVDGIVARNLPGIYYMMSRALGPGITGVIRDSVTLEPIEAEVQVTQAINADINPRLSRPDYGRYRRLLAPGSYTLRIIKTGYRQKTVNVTVGNSNPTNTDILLGPINPRPPAPQLIYPAPAESLSTRVFTFDWSDVTLATKYLLEVSSDSMFSNLIILDSNITASNFEVDSAMSNNHYYWRVKGGNANGWGPYSSKSDFFVDVQTGIDDESALPAEFRLKQNIPNPFNANTKICFELSKPSAVKLRIYDIRGSMVAQPLDAFMEAGNHSLIWNGKSDNDSPLASGVYFYSISADGIKAVRKMIMLK